MIYFSDCGDAMNDLKPIFGCCRFNPILPITYTDSISPYDQLCRMANKINEVIQALNNIDTDFKNYVDNQISALRQYVDEQNAEQTTSLTNMINSVDSKYQNWINTTYNNFVNETNDKFTAVYARIAEVTQEIYDYVNNADDFIKALMYQEIDKLKRYIDNSIMGKILIYDPTRGYKNPLNVVIEHVYDTLRYWGYTAQDFDGYGVTCTEFDNKGLSALKLDVYGKDYFSYYYPHYLFDFENGTYDNVQNVMYRFVQTTRPNSISATGFDSDSKDTTALDALEFTAVGFDTTATTILSA